MPCLDLLHPAAHAPLIAVPASHTQATAAAACSIDALAHWYVAHEPPHLHEQPLPLALLAWRRVAGWAPEQLAALVLAGVELQQLQQQPAHSIRRRVPACELDRARAALAAGQPVRALLVLLGPDEAPWLLPAAAAAGHSALVEHPDTPVQLVVPLAGWQQSAWLRLDLRRLGLYAATAAGAAQGVPSSSLAAGAASAQQRVSRARSAACAAAAHGQLRELQAWVCAGARQQRPPSPWQGSAALVEAACAAAAAEQLCTLSWLVSELEDCIRRTPMSLGVWLASPLMRACEAGCAGAAAMLMDVGARPCAGMLAEALAGGHGAVVSALLARHPELLPSVNEQYMALAAAARRQQAGVVCALLDAGCGRSGSAGGAAAAAAGGGDESGATAVQRLGVEVFWAAAAGDEGPLLQPLLAALGKVLRGQGASRAHRIARLTAGLPMLQAATAAAALLGHGPALGALVSAFPEASLLRPQHLALVAQLLLAPEGTGGVDGAGGGAGAAGMVPAVADAAQAAAAAMGTASSAAGFLRWAARLLMRGPLSFIDSLLAAHDAFWGVLHDALAEADARGGGGANAGLPAAVSMLAAWVGGEALAEVRMELVSAAGGALQQPQLRAICQRALDCGQLDTLNALLGALPAGVETAMLELWLMEAAWGAVRAGRHPHLAALLAHPRCSTLASSVAQLGELLLSSRRRHLHAAAALAGGICARLAGAAAQAAAEHGAAAAPPAASNNGGGDAPSGATHAQAAGAAPRQGEDALLPPQMAELLQSAVETGDLLVVRQLVASCRLWHDAVQQATQQLQEGT